MREYTPDAVSDFESFFREGLPIAIRVIRHLVIAPAEAEDAAAEAFVRAFAAWPRVRRLEYRLPWVLRVATNLALDGTRSESRRRTAWLRSAADGTEASVEPMDRIAVSQALAAALRRLPRRQREAIVLRYLADLSVEEVADSLGMKPGTAKTHLHRGMVALRKRIGADWEGNEVAL
jgi:RNA polymerase sigma factor (sigma-70 family)